MEDQVVQQAFPISLCVFYLIIYLFTCLLHGTSQRKAIIKGEGELNVEKSFSVFVNVHVLLWLQKSRRNRNWSIHRNGGAIAETTGQGSDSVTREEKEQGMGAIHKMALVGVCGALLHTGPCWMYGWLREAEKTHLGELLFASFGWIRLGWYLQTISVFEELEKSSQRKS